MKRHDEAGMTLIEVTFTCVILVVVAGLGVTSYGRYAQVQEASGTATALTSALRNAQQRAQTESVQHCLSFESTTWSLWRSACGTGTKVSDGEVLGNSTVLLPGAAAGTAAGPGFTASSGAARQVVFKPRGSATGGWIVVKRDDLVRKISVEGLTGRVSVSD